MLQVDCVSAAAIIFGSWNECFELGPWISHVNKIIIYLSIDQLIDLVPGLVRDAIE